MKTQLLRILLVVAVLCVGVNAALAFYDPGAQRWINRDPILEAGGINLNSFVGNRVPNRIDPQGLAEGDGVCPGTPKGMGDNCYQYACGTSGRNSDWCGASAGKRLPEAQRQDCDAIKKAAIADFEKAGLSSDKAVPVDGKCPEGTHKVGYAAGNGATQDYHWFLESNDGKSWCYKFRGSAPSNLGGDGKAITDPKPGDIFNFPGTRGRTATSYKFCGYLCAPDVKN